MSQRKRIIQYLIGEASEQEQSLIEQQYFADAEFLNEVQSVCEEIIDDYLGDAMSIEERARFEKRLQSLPFLSEQVETARTLSHYRQVSANSNPVRAVIAALGKGWNMSAFWPRLAGVGVACGLLIAGIWYGRQWFQSGSPELSPNTVAQATVPLPISPNPSAESATAAGVPSAPVLPSPPVAKSSRSSVKKPAVLPVVASLFLSADVVRSENQLPQLSLPALDGQLRLQLELYSAERKVYQAELQTSQGRTLRTWRSVKAISSEQISIVELLIPTDQLPRGEYLITLASGTPAPYRFRFSVRRK